MRIRQLRAKPTGTSLQYAGRLEDTVGAELSIQNRRMCLTQPTSRSVDWHRGERPVLAIEIPVEFVARARRSNCWSEIRHSKLGQCRIVAKWPISTT